jgi:predicted Holliday junction resolvase-like endonuclease
MLKQTSFAHQKQVLEQFSSLLSTFENEFKELVRKLEQGITSLYEEHGLMEEIYEDYRNMYLQSLKSSLAELLSRVQEEDIPFIEKEIDFLSSR